MINTNSLSFWYLTYVGNPLPPKPTKPASFKASTNSSLVAFSTSTKGKLTLAFLKSFSITKCGTGLPTAELNLVSWPITLPETDE